MQIKEKILQKHKQRDKLIKDKLLKRKQNKQGDEWVDGLLDAFRTSHFYNKV